MQPRHRAGPGQRCGRHCKELLSAQPSQGRTRHGGADSAPCPGRRLEHEAVNIQVVLRHGGKGDRCGAHPSVPGAAPKTK
eukprot:scaffold20698_cov111-Isochrysis_galbana.AAC.4